MVTLEKTIDRYIYPTNISGEFEAVNQKFPTFISINNQLVGIKFGTEKLEFCNNLKLFFQDSTGTKTLLHTADWSNTKVGYDGLYVSNIFPNIDLQAQAMEGSFKTSFIVKNILGLEKRGWLIVSDQILAPTSTTVTFSSTLDSDNKIDGDVYFNNATNQNFSILQGIVLSQNPNITSPLYYRMVGSNFEMITNSTWLNDSLTQYPIIIDPIVSNSNTLPQASITGSGLNNSGTFTNFCSYNLTVPRPANCTLTDITWSFNYIANSPTRRYEGAVRYTLGGCLSPSAAGFYWFCNLFSSGGCNGLNVSVWPDLSPCVSPLSACSGNLTFGMQFFYSSAGATCSNARIGANSAWTMTLIGKTLETLSNTITGDGVLNLTPACNTTQLLDPTPLNGVGPYTYLWSPGGQITSTKTIPTFFLGTQTHTCYVTDACGVTRTAIFNVSPTCVLPVELISYEANYNGNFVNIDWATASEINSNYFTLERSYDGINFAFVEKVNAAGQSYSTIKYNSQDFNPNKNGITYYRLKQFDTNGYEKFSKITSIDISENATDLLIAPNPNNGMFDITFSNNLIGKTVNIELFDITGKRKTLKQNLPINQSNKSLNIDISEVSKGMYFIILNSNDGSINKCKIIKN